MAGKSNTSATFFAQKKLLGKAHTSNLKVDGEEVIGSNIQSATNLLFGETIPTSPGLLLNTVQSASVGGAATVEYIQFVLNVLTGTTYDANDTGGGAGSDSGESGQSSGPHSYKFVLPSNYESISNNTRKGNGVFDNGKLVHETLGSLQLVPPFFSQDAPNPYIVKVFEDDGSGGVGDEIPLLDNIDWNVDYYNGILFLQDYVASKIPAFAKAFAYVGKMAQEVISSGSSGGGGGGSGDAGAEYVITKTTGSLPNAKLLEAGSGITILTGSNTVTISSDFSSINGREKLTYFVTSSHSALSPLDITGADFSSVQYDSNKIDVSFNGQLLHTGSISQVTAGDRDYALSPTGSIIFGFELVNDDIVDAITSTVGGGGGGSGDGDSSASYLVLANTGSLSNERALVAGTGISGIDAGANGNYTLNIDDSVVVTLTSSATFSNGLSGSLTHLSDGTSYLIAGDNITIVSGSNGAITINSTVTVPTREKATYEVTNLVSSGSVFTTSNSTYSDAGFDINAIDVYLNGQLLMSGTDSQVGTSAADYFVNGSTQLKFGFDLSPEDIVNVILTPTASSGGGGGGSGTTYTAGSGLNLNGNEFSVDNSIFASLSGSQFSGNVGVTGSFGATTFITSSVFRGQALSGSLTTLQNGDPYLIAGSNITLATASNGQITITSTATGTTEVSEDTSPVLGGQLVTGDHKIAFGTGDNTSEIDFTYNGGGNFTAIASVKSIDMFLDLNGGDTGQKFRIFNNLQPASSHAGGTNTDTNAIFMVREEGNVFAKGYVTASMGFSGSLTQLTDGTSYLIAGSNVSISSASNGSVTISSTDNNTTYTAGTGLNLNSTEFSVNDSVVATISGSQFSGNVGITGSLGVESTTIFNGGIHENFETKSAATGVVVHDCSTGHIFFHSGSSSNFTTNFTNLNLATAYATNLTLLVTQSATAYIPSAVQIDGSSQTLMWQGGSAPSGTSNGQDVISFSILNNSGSYVVLGQLVGFG